MTTTEAVHEANFKAFGNPGEPRLLRQLGKTSARLNTAEFWLGNMLDIVASLP
jgi:hypothetical protein